MNLSLLKHAQLKEKFNPEGSKLRKAQLRMLEMLQFLDKICQEHNIEYWLDSGNLLGAIRHGGFIPWDDDVDVCMTKENIRKFKNIIRTKYKGSDFIVQDIDNDPNYFTPWPKLRDTKSKMIGGNQLFQKYQGLQIDIFTVQDYNITFFQKICYWLNWHLYLINVPLQKHTIYKFIWPVSKLSRWIFYQIVIPSLDFISRPFKHQYFTFCYGSEFYKKNERRYKRDIFPLTRIKFENIGISVPANQERYLTRLFGNWRKLPDLTKLTTHFHDVVFLEKTDD